jgi:hypothetical protein
MDRDRMENDLDRALAADRALVRSGRVDRLEDLERMTVGAAILVRRHGQQG